MKDIKEQINNSSSLNDEEKTYWLDLLWLMNENQINRLSDILRIEEEKLKELNRKILTKYGKGIELES